MGGFDKLLFILLLSNFLLDGVKIARLVMAYDWLLLTITSYKSWWESTLTSGPVRFVTICQIFSLSMGEAIIECVPIVFS